MKCPDGLKIVCPSIYSSTQCPKRFSLITWKIHNRVAVSITRISAGCSSDTRRSIPSLLQPLRIDKPKRVGVGVGVGVGVSVEAYGVGLDGSSSAWVIIAVLVVIEIGQAL